MVIAFQFLNLDQKKVFNFSNSMFRGLVESGKKNNAGQLKF